MSRIIISYRRADSAAISGRIFDRLASHYGEDAVFMDVDKIPFGTDFRDHIRKVLAGGNILVAVIGPSWLGKAADGTSRIKDEADPVRVEIESALRQKTRIIPVLVDGASMPSVADLPDALRDFAYLNAAPIDVGRDFRAHMDRLIRSIDDVLGPVRVIPAQASKRRSGARVALIAVLSVIVIALVGTMGFTLLAPIPEPPRPPAPESTATLPAPTAPAPREVAAAPTVATPEPATYRVLANVSDGVQNLREGPGVRYAIIVPIPAGAGGITLLGCERSRLGTRPWCEVRWRTYKGYISSCCIVDERTGAAPRIE
jgi:TIR domain-containing protein